MDHLINFNRFVMIVILVGIIQNKGELKPLIITPYHDLTERILHNLRTEMKI